ncbi:MAG TPA: hypothetical protein VKB93_21030 [Thermoanaerobaculia bacterium]|nr:hypothetical protein [Thermoanaerobaculia bacterium]
MILQAGCLGGITGTLQQTNVEVRNAVDSFDRAIDTLARESADWQVVLQDLERTIVADVQSTTRVELTNLMRTGLLGAGAEFRCDADYLRLRTAGELRRIRNDLAASLNAAGVRPPIPLLDVPAPEPHICSVVPAAVDISTDPPRRAMLDVYGYDLRSLPIGADVINSRGVRTNVTHALGVISDTQMVLDLTSGGANLDSNHRQIAFAWNNRVQSVVRVLAPGSVAPVCTTREERVRAAPQTFIPPHVAGDQEFFGHGPCVRFRLELRLDAMRNELTAFFDMKAFECDGAFDRPQSDFTAAEGSGQAALFRVANPADQIESFNVDPVSTFDYIDNDELDDMATFAGRNPVEKLIFTGDTSGSEAGTRTKVEIYFRELPIRVRECH